MLTKVEIERQWREWVNHRTLSLGMGLTDRLRLMDDLAKEVRWFLYTRDSEKNLEMRIRKYEMLRDSTTMKIDDFEPNWQHKIEFFKWIKGEAAA
jgi:hypothetical protein